MIAEVRFNNLLIVAVVAVAVPILLGLAPRMPIPATVIEIVAGILIGPAVLGWVRVDEPIDVLSRLGVAFLLFLAGFELDFHTLRGRSLRLGLLGFVGSIIIGLALTVPLGAGGVVLNPLLITVILCSTSLGIVVPVLKDADQLRSHFGGLVVAACSVAEFGSIVLLSMFFSGRGAPRPLVTTIKLALLFVAVLAIAALTVRARRPGRLSRTVQRLQDTSAQIRVRLAVLILLGLLVLSQTLGFDSILGAFLAGALLSALTHPDRDPAAETFKRKIEAVGFGVFVPVFFVTTGIQFPLSALFSDPASSLRIVLFLALLLAVRGAPALVFRADISKAQTVAAGLMQATSLSFIVMATTVGVSLRELRPVNAAALVAAGMLSVLLFPAAALVILRRGAGAELGPVVGVVKD